MLDKKRGQPINIVYHRCRLSLLADSTQVTCQSVFNTLPPKSMFNGNIPKLDCLFQVVGTTGHGSTSGLILCLVPNNLVACYPLLWFNPD